MADEHGLPDRVDLALRAAHYREERDRALQQLRPAQAKAWLEGWQAGMYDAARAQHGAVEATVNPYRETSVEPR